MPTKPIDYSKVSFYKLCCKDTNITDIYIGHTTNFTRRKNEHKNNCNNETGKHYNIYVYQFIRDIGNWDNWSMIEICNRSCENKRDAELIERTYIEELNATLNKQIPTRNHNEYSIKYYQDNKEQINQVHKAYREDHKEEIKERRKKYYEDNIDIIREQHRNYYKANKDIKKQYQEDHKKEIKERRKNYREDHKEEIKEIGKKYYEDNIDIIREKNRKYYEANKNRIKERRKQRLLTK